MIGLIVGLILGTILGFIIGTVTESDNGHDDDIQFDEYDSRTWWHK